MMMTIVVVVLKDKFLYTMVHSNHHHLRIFKAISGNFLYNFIGDRLNKKILTEEELFKVINKNNNKCDSSLTMDDWTECKDLRSLKWITDDHISGYIIIDYSCHDTGYVGDEIYANLSTTEAELTYDHDIVLQFKAIMKYILRKRKWANIKL